MDKCTQNLDKSICDVDIKPLNKALFEQILLSANEAIALYVTRPSRALGLYCEDALTDLIPFAKLVETHNVEPLSSWLLHTAIANRLDKLQRGESICEIEMPGVKS